MSNNRADWGSKKAMESNKQNPYSTTIKTNNALVRKGVMLNKSSYRYNEITSKYGDLKDITPVAWYNSTDINNITKSLADTRIYHGGVKNAPVIPKYESTDLVNGKVYERLNNVGFFEAIAKKHQTGKELYDGLITYDKTQNIMTNKSNSMSNLMNFSTLNNNLHKVNEILSNKGTIAVFDTETVSGINQFGHSTLSNITEISGVKFKVENGVATVDKRINTVLGFTAKEAEDARKKLDKMMSKGADKWTNEERVFYERMNIYGNSSGKQNGFSFEITKAKGIDDINTSRQYAEKGIAFLEDVTKRQQEWMKNNGITSSYEDYRIKQLKEFKEMLKNSDIAQGHNISQFDMRQLDIATGDNSPLTNLFDTLGVTNYSMNELGANSIYAKNANRINFKRGRATQEALAEAHNLKDKSAAAHIAINDVMENALFLFGDIDGGNSISGTKFNISKNSYFNKVMMPNMKKVNKIMGRTEALYKGSNQLFYMDYTMQKNWMTQDGALSFEYNPGDNSFKTYDGYTIKNGKVSNSGYSAFGPRKGAIYQHNIHELEMNENFKKHFMSVSGAGEEQANKIFQQYANASKLYIVESKQYMDIESLTKKLGSRELAEHYIKNAPTTYTIETNYNRLGANLGINVGEIVDGKVVANEKAIRGLGFKRTEFNGEAIVKDAKDIDADLLLSKLVNKSYDRTINDPAARKIRNLDYKQLMQIRNYQKDLVQNKGINSSTPIVTRISQMISQNKKIDLSVNEEIVNAFGWHDYKKDTSKTVKESINNAMTLDNYISKMGNVFDSIDEILDEAYGKLPDISTPEKFSKAMSDKKNRELLMKRDLGFKQLYNDFLDDVTNASPKLGNSWAETYHTSAELNKIDFFTADLAPEKIAKKMGGSPRNFTSNITSIDLNKPNGLLDTFYNLKFKDLDERGLVTKKGNAGYDALLEAYNAIREDERFGKSLFRDVNIHDRSIGVDALNDAMTAELISFVKDKRSKDLSFGYINPRMNQDVISGGALVDHLSKFDKDTIKTAIAKNKINLVDDFKLITADGGREAAIQDLVNNYFLTFSKSDLDFDGFTNVQKTYMSKQYDIAKRTAESKAGSLIDAIKGTNIQLAISNTASGPAVNLIQGNEVTELSNLFRFNHRKGVMTTQLGTEEYALKMGLGRYEKEFRLSNTVEKVVLGHWDHKNAEWATKRGDSIVDAIAYNNNLTASLIRDHSSRIDISNGQLLSQGFQFDVNEMITALPDLYDRGIIEDLEYTYKIDDKAKASIRKVIDNIKDNERRYKDKAFTKILPVELNFFSDNYLNPLLEKIINNENNFTAAEREMLKGVGVKSKNTALFKGFLSGIEEYYVDPLAGLDNDNRPPVTQMQNTKLYDKAVTETAVEKLQKTNSDIYKSLNATSVYTSDSMEKFLYSNVDKATGKAATSGLTMKYMQIDSYSLRNQFMDENNLSKMDKYLENNFNKSDLQRAQEVIRDRAKKLSTYEQQSAMDARVHDINFHRSNSQTIAAKKKLIAEHTENLGVIKDLEDQNKLFFTIEDGKIKYELGIKVKKGDKLGRFGTEQFSQDVTSKYNGMFRGRYFDTHGNVVSEDVLNNIIKESKIDITDNNAIIKKLDSMFTFKYQVLGMEELHGTKAFLGASEKTTIDSMKLAIGEVDRELKQVFVNSGMGDIVGKVVSKDYLDEVVYKELITQFGTEGANTVMDRILKERYAFSDAVHAIDAFKDVTFITNLDVNKHSSATALMHDGLNYLRDNNALTEENLDKIFGEGKYELVDGRVKIKEGLKEVNLKFDKDSILYDAFNRQDNIVRDADGKAIGYTAKAHLVSVIDDPAGTSSGIFDGEVRGKGVKFTDAMGRNLDRQTYNIDCMTKVYNHYKEMGQLDEFRKVFGHALDLESFDNGVLAFNKEFANQSMAAPATEILRKQLIKTNHGRTLADVAIDKDRSKYEHLLSSTSRAEWGNVSVDRAELMFSHIMGNKAIEINTVNTDAIVEKFTGDGYKDFKIVDWTKDSPDWLDLQIGGQGNSVIHSDLNPYTNNLIIKTGLGGQSEYIAIGRMPEIHTGDNLIQEKHISMLTGLQQKMQTYIADPNEKTKKNLEDHIKLYKSQMIQDVNGKEGLIKELTEYRMQQSFMGKGSGVIMAGLDSDGKSLLGSGNVERLNELNADIFKTATFNGKTLNQHYAEGKVIDSVFMGEQAFRDMGYFDQEFMDKTFSNLNDDFKKKLNIDQLNSIEDTVLKVQAQEDAMKHLLRTQGDAFITVRYPEIMQGSDKFAMGYLDDSLKANEVRVLGPTGMSAKLDFDGDTFNVARMSTADGLSRLNTVVAAEVNAEAVALSNAIDSSIITRATTDNAYWQKQVDNFMTGKKGWESMHKGMNLEQIASHKLINGKAYMASLDKSEEELFGLFDKYKDVIGNKDLKNQDLIDAIHKIDDSENAIHDYVAAKSWSDRRDMITAKVYNNAIGETDVTNQKIKSEISGLLPKDLEDYEYKSNLLVDFLYQAEEQAISSKSSIEGLVSDRAQQWNRSVSGLMKGTGSRELHLENMENWLDSNLRGNLASGLYFAKSESFYNRMQSEFGINTIEEFNKAYSKQGIGEIGRKIDDILIKDIVSIIDEASSLNNASEVFESLKVASSQSGGTHRLAQNMMFIKDQETNMKTVYNAYDTIFNEKLSKNLDMSEFTNSRQFRESIESTISSATDNISKVSTEAKIGGIIDSIGDFAKSAKGSKLAKGAIGIAAGIMVAGFVGGRPRPADVHAMEEARDYQTPMEGYQLADPGMVMGGGQQGYVININARTSKGRDNAAQALQQAIASGTNANINIAMNITNDYGNINDREIEKAILGAL